MFKQNSKITHPKNIFLLTDGAISETQSVIDLISQNSHTAWVHTFGIGSGASSYLVTESARVGNGVSYMIHDNDPTLNAKVISTLKKVSSGAFT